jgi:hypothetical protein
MDGKKELTAIFRELSLENQAKLLRYARRAWVTENEDKKHDADKIPAGWKLALPSSAGGAEAEVPVPQKD